MALKPICRQRNAFLRDLYRTFRLLRSVQSHTVPRVRGPGLELWLPEIVLALHFTALVCQVLITAGY